jgi:HEAT repeat protein
MTKVAERGDAAAVAAIMGRLEDNRSEVRCNALSALVDLDESSAPSENGDLLLALMGRTKDGSSDVRSTAFIQMSKIAECGNKLAINAAMEGLQDYSHDVRKAAVRSLAHVALRGDATVLDAVLKCASDDHDIQVQNAAAHVLAKLEEPTARARGACGASCLPPNCSSIISVA